MANPVFKDCPKNVWTKVATAVTQGVVHIVDGQASYLQTYRETGGAVPTARTEGVSIVPPGERIGAPVAVDVYVYCTGHAGRVRVDAWA